ncbi:hypothetical protein [Actinorhabdospora filicis]|nr:hypothetical protein [Actinorhabdospora filicis]
MNTSPGARHHRTLTVLSRHLTAHADVAATARFGRAVPAQLAASFAEAETAFAAWCRAGAEALRPSTMDDAP